MSKGVKAPVTGPANQAQLKFNESANSDKVSETGLCYFHGPALADGLLGALNAAKRCGKNKPVLIFNTDVAVHYVSFGAVGMAAPAGGATGVPLMPAQGIVLASGSNEYVRSDSALVFGFCAEENIVE